MPSTFLYSYFIDKKPGVKSLGQGFKGRNEVRLGWESDQTSKARLFKQHMVFQEQTALFNHNCDVFSIAEEQNLFPLSGKKEPVENHFSNPSSLRRAQRQDWLHMRKSVQVRILQKRA